MYSLNVLLHQRPISWISVYEYPLKLNEFAPPACNEWVSTLDGNTSRWVITFCYGHVYSHADISVLQMPIPSLHTVSWHNGCILCSVLAHVNIPLPKCPHWTCTVISICMVKMNTFFHPFFWFDNLNVAPIALNICSLEESHGIWRRQFSMSSSKKDTSIILNSAVCLDSLRLPLQEYSPTRNK